jgi:N-acetylneuraminate lyase
MRQNFTPLLRGLVVAAHTPFNADGSLNLAVVEKQAAHFVRHKLATVFVGGTTGECSSLTSEERRALTEQWVGILRMRPLKAIIHVGSNCLEDARALAAHAQAQGATAIAAHAPCYFKPRSAAALVDFMAAVASAAPNLPFYYYEIPSHTGVALPPSEFLALAAERIPTLAGLKFTSSDLMDYQLCLNFRDGAFDVAFGFDEMLLPALALGAKGAVGATYNFATPVYQRLAEAFGRGDLNVARQEQLRSVRLIQLLAARGFMGATKAVMEMLNVPVGPARLPNANLTPDEVKELRVALDQLGFFSWL